MSTFKKLELLICPYLIMHFVTIQVIMYRPGRDVTVMRKYIIVQTGLMF